MKKLSTLFSINYLSSAVLLLFLPVLSVAQIAPLKQWDKTFGGSDQDLLRGLQQTADGGYILGGYSASNATGDKTQNTLGGNDYWVVKVNASGAKVWDKSYGGSNNDELLSLEQLLMVGIFLVVFHSQE